VKNEIVEAINNLDDWAKPETLKQGMPYKFETVLSVPEPYGLLLNSTSPCK
jgi:hypothetical protein